MMAEIPSGAFEIPDYALWGISGWVLGALISGYTGDRLGLRSQKQVARLNAQNAVCAFIDRILADLWDNRSLWGQEGKAQSELKKLTLEFSSQFGETDRARIKKALDYYQKLFIRFFEWPAKGTPEREVFKKEYEAMMSALKKLRDEISST